MLNLFLLQALNGVQFGILLFLVAAGLTLVFGVMDLINLAHGALYMIGAYLAATFAAWTGSFFLGLLLTLPASFLVGLVLERLVFRHLYARDHLDQVLATFGLILMADEGVKTIWGAAPLGVAMPDLLSGSLPLIGTLRYPVFRFAIIAAGLAAALGLSILVNRTRAGMLLRAGATHAPMVSALGVDIGRLFSLVFGLGAMLAGFAGAMIAPDPLRRPRHGRWRAHPRLRGDRHRRRRLRPRRLRRLPAGRIARHAGPQLRPLAAPLRARSGGGRPDRPHPRPDAHLPADGRHPRHPARRPVPRQNRRRMKPALALFAALAVAPLVFGAIGEPFLLVNATRIVILALAALSLDLILGYGGLVSFGHAAFLGIGAYAVAIMSSFGVTDLLLQVAVAIAAASFFALVTGAISLRTTGVYFIMITLAFGQMAFFLMVSLSAYGGDNGVSLPGRSTLFGHALLGSDTALFYVSLLVLALAFALLSRVVRSRFGRVLRGSRDNAIRMQAIGFAPFRYRLLAYAISGALAAVSGVLLANQTGFVSPAYMTWQRSGELIVMVVLGGQGTLIGAVAGAIAFLLLEDGLSQLSEHWRLGLGAFLVLLVLFGRGGLAGLARRLSPA